VWGGTHSVMEWLVCFLTYIDCKNEKREMSEEMKDYSHNLSQDHLVYKPDIYYTIQIDSYLTIDKEHSFTKSY